MWLGVGLLDHMATPSYSILFSIVVVPVYISGSPFLLGSHLCDLFLFAWSRDSFSNGRLTTWVQDGSHYRKTQLKLDQTIRESSNSFARNSEIKWASGLVDVAAPPWHSSLKIFLSFALIHVIRWVSPNHEVTASRKEEFLPIYSI